MDQHEVYILFSGGLRDEYQECAKRLAPETVMFIEVRPKAKLKLDDLKLDKRTLQQFKSGVRLTHGHKAYHTTDGLLINTARGLVIRHIYLPDNSDPALCPSYYERPESFVETLWDHPPPTLNIECPGNSRTGTDVILRSSASIDAKRGPIWRTNAGKIVSGQHTYKITIDTSGVAARTIVVTAELNLIGHYIATSCEIVILPK